MNSIMDHRDNMKGHWDQNVSHGRLEGFSDFAHLWSVKYSPRGDQEKGSGRELIIQDHKSKWFFAPNQTVISDAGIVVT